MWLKGKIGLFMTAAAVLIGTTEPTSNPRVLTPVGPWDVHVSENGCSLGRNFGGTQPDTSLVFRPFFTAPMMEIVIVTRDVSADPRSGTVRIAVSPSKQTLTAHYDSVRLPDGVHRASRITVKRAVWDALTSADYLTIDTPPVSLQVPIVRFAAAERAFEKCERDLLESWGVDSASLDPARSPTLVSHLSSIFTGDAYPKAALIAGLNGNVVTLLTVDADGAVADCRILAKSWPVLNDASCKGAKRLRFKAPRDAAGAPRSSIYVLPVSWRQPGY